MNWKVLHGDARSLDLEDKSVHLICTSVPYWQQRSYLDDWREIGRENVLQDWLDNLAVCAQEWKRVLRQDGTLWVNVGTAYASRDLEVTTKYRLREDLSPKEICYVLSEIAKLENTVAIQNDEN